MLGKVIVDRFATCKGIVRNFSNVTFDLYKGLKISKISVYSVKLPLHELSYKWSGGNSVEAFDATVVRVETNEGVVGHGENTPLGPCYLPAYAEGTRAGIHKMGPSLLGVDPTRLNNLNYVMDKTLKGHPYVKSAIDMACWDILGKISGLPVCELLGGRFNDSFPLYRAISQGSAEAMAKNVESYVNQGYRKFQLKVGGKPWDDIQRIRAVRQILDKKTAELRANGEPDLYMPLLCDANTGWKMHEAIQVINGVKDLDVYIEQPCLTYEECLSVRRMSPLPMVLDECMDDIGE